MAPVRVPQVDSAELAGLDLDDAPGADYAVGGGHVLLSVLGFVVLASSSSEVSAAGLKSQTGSQSGDAMFRSIQG